LEELFRHALEIPAGEERDHFLSTECGDDDDLRRRVEALIRAHLSAGGFLDPSNPARAVRSGLELSDSHFGSGIAGLRVLERVAEGGFCVVYLAEQIEPMRRPVALKILKPGLDVRAGNRRFEAERQALAVMDHPNIARIYGAGSTSDGQPYLVLEWIRGPMVDCYADAAKLTLRARLSLFLQICAGIAHAHERGVIHQDIKPANILVPEYDGAAVPKIIDFGMALSTRAPDESGCKAADEAELVGTPAYMSPEQVFGVAGGVDARTDVFSLGAVLHELLTGLPPFEGEKCTHVDPESLRRAIQSRRFLKPSTRVEQCEPTQMMVLAAHRQKKPSELAAALRDDLDAILTKALEADRENRYATVNDLADDIRLHLGDRQVSAAKQTWTGRGRHFARRHAAALTTAAVVSGLLLVTVLTTLIHLLKSRVLRHQVIQQEAVATEAEQQKIELHSRQLQALGMDAVGRQNAAEAMAWFSQAARLSPPESRERQLNQRRVHALAAAVALPVRVLQLSGPLQSLEFSPEGGHLLALAEDGQCTLWDWQADQVLDWSQQVGPVTAAEWSPESMQVALGLQSGAVEIRQVPTGEVVRRLEFGESVRTVRFSPDGRQLAVGGKTVRLWQEPLGEWLAWRWDHPAPVFALRYSADGEHLVSACLDRQARVFSLSSSGTEGSPAPGVFHHEAGQTGVTPEHCAAALIRTDPLAPLFFGADNRLLTWTAMGELTAWDSTEKRIFRTLEGTCLATRLVQSPNGNWIAVTFPHGSAQFWMPETLAGPAAMSVKHQERICDLAFGPQSEWVMTASADRTARLWQLPQGTPMLSPLMHSREVAHAAVSRNGRWVGTAQLDGQLRVWRLPSHQEDTQSLTLGLSGRWNVHASPRGRRILLTQMAQNGPESAILLHGEDSRYEQSQLEFPGGFVDAAWSSEGDLLATLTRRRGTDVPAIAGHLELRMAAALSHPSRNLDLPFLPSRLAWHPNGESLVISDTQGGLWQASFDGPKPLTAWPTQAEAVNLQDETLAFSASGNYLIRSWTEGRIEVWDATLQRLRFSQDAPDSSRRLVTPSPTERHLLITESDGKSQLIHLEDGQVLGKPLKHSGGVVAQGFSPDGSWVVTSGHDGRLQIQDWRTGEMICPPLNHADEVFGFCFSADGGWLATACRDGTFHVWDTQSGTGLLPVESVHEPLFGVRLDKENRWAVLTGAGSTVWIRSLRLLQEATDWSIDESTLLSEATSGLAMDCEPPVKLSSSAWEDRMNQIRSLRHDYFDP